MTATHITPKQAAKWAAQNGFRNLPKGMRWEFHYGVQRYTSKLGDASYLLADDNGLYGIVGFTDKAARV